MQQHVRGRSVSGRAPNASSRIVLTSKLKKAVRAPQAAYHGLFIALAHNRHRSVQTVYDRLLSLCNHKEA